MSKKIKIRGIIIKESPVGESDKYLTIFTKDRGKITIRARGAKNAKSKFLTAQMFSYCDFVCFHGGTGTGFLSLTQVELIESFYNLRIDYDRLMIAYDIAKIIDKYMAGSLDDVTDPIDSSFILLLLIKSFLVLSKNKIDKELIYNIFRIKFLQILGLAPHADNGLVHTEYDNIKINNTLQYAINYILTQSIDTVFNFNIDESALTHLSKICDVLVKSLDI